MSGHVTKFRIPNGPGIATVLARIDAAKDAGLLAGATIYSSDLRPYVDFEIEWAGR